jgi:hypothetical protein
LFNEREGVAYLYFVALMVKSLAIELADRR